MLHPRDYVQVSDQEMRELLVRNLVWFYGFSIVVSFGFFFGWGAEKLKFPDKFVYSLLGATVGEIAGMLYVIIRSLFGAKDTRKKAVAKSESQQSGSS